MPLDLDGLYQEGVEAGRAAAEIERLRAEVIQIEAETVRLRSYNQGLDVIQRQMEAEIERLRATCAKNAQVQERLRAALNAMAEPATAAETKWLMDNNKPMDWKHILERRLELALGNIEQSVTKD